MSTQDESGLAITTHGLTKEYGDNVRAVDGIDLRIPNNTIFALLGPNGAGKTTTVSMLTTLVEPTAGSARVAGYDVVDQADEVRRRIGVTFQEIVVDPDLTGRESLDYHGRLYSMGKSERRVAIDKLLALLELEDAADRRTNTYSGGMKRRLELARGLMTDPSVLFLDEPTQGLDPQNRTNIWAYIRSLKEEQGMTLLLTTHYMDEAEALADRVAIIDNGRIVIEGTPRELIAEMGSDVIHVQGEGNREAFSQAMEALPFVQNVDVGDGLIQIGVDAGNRRLAEVVTVANVAGFIIDDISVAKPNLGDVFLKHTGRQLRDL